MSVDLRRGETLPIHINMTFPSLPCDGWYWCFQNFFLKFFLHFALSINFSFFCVIHAVLSVDAIDMSGKHEVDLDTNIWKVRISFISRQFYSCLG